jgi:predicted small secreted protein
MFKKAIGLLILTAFALSLAGCNTIGGAAQGAANGAKKDCEAAKKLDAKVKQELW